MAASPHDIETTLEGAAEALEKANANLEVELFALDDAAVLLSAYARIERLAAFGKAALAGRIDDAKAVARATGTSVGKARQATETGKRLRTQAELSETLKAGELSLDQAVLISEAEEASPGAAAALVATATTSPYHVLRDAARKVKLEAESHRDLGLRQREARAATHRVDGLGMVDVHLSLEPHVGAPIVARAEADARRRATKAKREGRDEAFAAHLADAFAAMLEGQGRGSRHNVEMTVLVSHEVAARGWTHVEEGELCSIPGMGPVPPRVAQEIAHDAFLNGVFFDGTDLRHFKRFGRHKPPEIRAALNLGPPPDFDGRKCTRCGNRFRPETDHRRPVAAGGETSSANLDDLCWACHRDKTGEDRRAGLLDGSHGPDRDDGGG